MNALGEVVGESSMSYTLPSETVELLGSHFGWSGVRGFVWTQKTMSEVGHLTRLTGDALQFTLVGSFAPVMPANNTWSLDIRVSGSARAIDDTGKIYVDFGPRGLGEASLWPLDTVTSLVTFTGPPPLASRTIASLNGVNTVSGNGIVGGFVSSGAATWSAQTGTRPLPDGTSSGRMGSGVFGIPSTMVNGVNNAGVAVGISKGFPVWWDAQGQVHEIDVPQLPSGNFDPCVSLGTDCHSLVITNSGPYSHFGEVTGINNHNVMVGTSSEGGFLWQDGQLTKLHSGSENFNPMGINDHGDIVGSFSNGHAALRLADGSFLDLNSSADLPSGWSFSEAVAINDAGQIAANATRNGITHAFLLSPVPEPAVAWMFLVGLSALATRRIVIKAS